MVPRYLEERDPDGQGEDDGQDTNPTVVICSGELVEQVRGFHSLTANVGFT